MSTTILLLFRLSLRRYVVPVIVFRLFFLKSAQDLHINTGDFMLMYSLYSWPNVVLCFFGGLLMDKYIGVR